MNPYEVESQLSAMFDGELPAAECELLSRRIDRDEALRARWSRYALIGAAMRSEPVATARSGFAGRVSAALEEALAAPPSKRSARAGVRRTQRLWSGALAASLAIAVAGVSVVALRHAALQGGTTIIAQSDPTAPSHSSTLTALDAAAPAPAILNVKANAAGLHRPGNEPISYTTPKASAASTTMLRTQLADFIVAHSEYSTPLMRRNLLSALVSNDPANDNVAEGASPVDSSAGQLDASTAPSPIRH